MQQSHVSTSDPKRDATNALARTMTYNQLTSCPDMEPAFVRMYEASRPFTMTSLERMYGLFKAVEYVVSGGVAGDIVECGVWKGGSAMLAAMALRHFGQTQRRIWLYDTFEGMTQPGEADVDYAGIAAETHLERKQMKAEEWCRSELDEVRANMSAAEYPPDKLVFVKGKVEDTIPAQMPDRIAVLRLDTDWFESTWHELTHLFPRLAPGGVLIVDDYGHWRGCREAVDRYFAQHGVKMLLNRLDYTGRVGVKM